MTGDTQRSPFFICSHSDLQCCHAVQSHKARRRQRCAKRGRRPPAALRRQAGMRWALAGQGAERELPCAFSGFAELLSCHRKTAVCNLKAAAALWELLRVTEFYKQRSTNTPCLTLDIYSVWP